MNTPVAPSERASFATCDLCDAHKGDGSGAFRVLPPVFRDFGAVRAFCGPVTTVKCFEDNSLVKAAVDSPGEGRVLVVDGGGSLRRALLGDNLAALARDNGWAGVVIHGCVRDADALGGIGLGVKALGTNPRPPRKDGAGQIDVPVEFGGIEFTPGALLYADTDGVVVVPD